MPTEKVATPTASPSGGNYSTAQSVVLSCVTSPGVSIYYTVDGSTPSAAKTHYTIPISIAALTTLKAIGIKTGAVDSDIMTAVYTFAISIREKIMALVGAALTGILTAAGYKTNLGNKFFEWLATPVEDDEPPVGSYKETDSIEIFSTTQWKHTLAVEVLLFGNTPAQVRQEIADVIAAFGTNPSWGALAAGTDLTSESTGIDQKNKKIMVAHLTFNIYFYSLILNPDI